jgi:hypothetical protein
VNQLGGLLLDGGDDFRMAMAGGDNRDARSEIKKGVAVHVFDRRATADPGDQRVIAGVGRRDYVLVALDEFLGLGAGQLGNEVRQFRINFGVRRLHNFLQK